MGGKVEWLVASNYLPVFEGEAFLKLPPSCKPFVRLVCEGQLEEDNIPKTASLSGCSGMNELMELRNTKQCEELSSHNKPGCSLFDGEEQGSPPKGKGRPRRTRQQIKEARENPGILTVEVPGCDGREPMAIRMVRPVNARDDLCIPLDANVIEHIVLFIRDAGITKDALESRRAYKAAGPDAPKGIWCASQWNGYIVKLPNASDGPKYKRCKTIEAALQHASPYDEQLAPLADQEVDAVEDDNVEQHVAGGGEDADEDDTEEHHAADDADESDHDDGQHVNKLGECAAMQELEFCVT